MDAESIHRVAVILCFGGSTASVQNMYLEHTTCSRGWCLVAEAFVKQGKYGVQVFHANLTRR